MKTWINNLVEAWIFCFKEAVNIAAWTAVSIWAGILCLSGFKNKSDEAFKFCSDNIIKGIVFDTSK